MENRKKLQVSLVDQADTAFQEYKYQESGLMPSLYFWKELVAIQRQTPRVLIPDTLILNEKDSTLKWIYTNKEGRLAKSTNVSLKDYINKITNYCSPNELAATLKRLTNKEGNNNCGNDVKLVNSRFLHNLSIQQLGDQLVCLQKFVKSHGSHAFICRTIYNAKGMSSCFLITNKKSYYDQTEIEAKKFLVMFNNKCNIVKSSIGKNFQQTTSYLQDIVRYFRFQRGIDMNQIVGDFVKDEQGNWWLINIKAFLVEAKRYQCPTTLRDKPVLSLLNGDKKDENHDKQKYQKTKTCKYCEKTFLQSDLTHKMTRKMLIQMDRYLLHLGKQFKWLSRSDSNKVDSHCLYQDHKICERCYQLYTQIQNLMNAEGDFLKRLGFQLDKNPKQLLMNLTNTEELELQSKKKQIHNLKNDIPQVIELGPNSNILVKNNCPIRNDQKINKMYRYRLAFYFNEIDEVCGLKPNHNYYFQYSIFETKHRFKLQIYNSKANKIQIKKLRISYFFANADDDVQKHIAQEKILKIVLISENRSTNQRKNIGFLNLDTKQFLNVSTIKKCFYKFFHVEDVAYGWGLEGSIGLIRSTQLVNTSRLILSTLDKLVYLPNQNYYFCESLPEEWIEQIKSKAVQCKKRKTFLFSTHSEDFNHQESQQKCINDLQIQNRILSSQKQNSIKSALQQQIRQYSRVCLKTKKSKKYF